MNRSTRSLCVTGRSHATGAASDGAVVDIIAAATAAGSSALMPRPADQAADIDTTMSTVPITRVTPFRRSVMHRPRVIVSDCWGTAYNITAGDAPLKPTANLTQWVRTGSACGTDDGPTAGPGSCRADG